MNTLPKVLTFEDTDLSIIDRNGTPWVATPQIGAALGYKRENAVRNLYLRNQGEFTARMTQTVKLTVRGVETRVRIFSPRGCHLVAMFARTPKAKAFRRWVLDVLEGYTVQPPARRTRAKRDKRLSPNMRRAIRFRAHTLARTDYSRHHQAMTEEAIRCLEEGREIDLAEIQAMVGARGDTPALLAPANRQADEYRKQLWNLFVATFGPFHDGSDPA